MLDTWTLPQVMYAWLKQQEANNAQSRQTFQITMAAIGAVLSKDGRKIVKSVMDALSGPESTAEEMADDLSDQQKLILFGSKRLGRKTDPDPHPN